MEPGGNGKWGHRTGLEGVISNVIYIHERHDGMETGDGRDGSCLNLDTF